MKRSTGSYIYYSALAVGILIYKGLGLVYPEHTLKMFQMFIKHSSIYCTLEPGSLGNIRTSSAHMYTLCSLPLIVIPPRMGIFLLPVLMTRCIRRRAWVNDHSLILPLILDLLFVTKCPLIFILAVGYECSVLMHCITLLKSNRKSHPTTSNYFSASRLSSILFAIIDAYSL